MFLGKDCAEYFLLLCLCWNFFPNIFSCDLFGLIWPSLRSFIILEISQSHLSTVSYLCCNICALGSDKANPVCDWILTCRSYKRRWTSCPSCLDIVPRQSSSSSTWRSRWRSLSSALEPEVNINKITQIKHLFTHFHLKYTQKGYNVFSLGFGIRL